MPFLDLHDEEEEADNHHPHGGPPSPPSPKPNPKLLSLILKGIIMTFIIILFFLFLGVATILLLLATAALHRHHRYNQSSLSSVPSSGFSPKDLKRLSQFRCSNQRGCNEAECVICLDGIRQGQWCRRLSGCGHVFHRRCLDGWLVKVASCPVCRARIRLDSGNLLLGEDRTPVWGFEWRNDMSVW